ncbi:MAG: hypothetical protein AAGC60_22175 [Acidobacteriota bacterium]
MRSSLRLVSSCVVLSAWLVLLLVGNPFGGWVHGLLLAALGLWPWRRA